MLKHQLKRLSPPSTQSGFTIIESLLAILIVTALLVGIAPVITLSVATRLQARRVEQATQAARTYIDGVRSGKVATPERVVDLRETNEVTPGNNIFAPRRDEFSETPAPPQAIAITDLNCRSTRPAFPYCINQPRLSLYCADFDGDGACSNRSTTDLIVQAFRSRIDPTDDGSKGYLLGVRVYRAAAFNGNTNFQRTKDVGRKARTNTGGTGDYRVPLVELTTEVQTRPDPAALPEKQYNDFCARLGGCQ